MTPDLFAQLTAWKNLNVEVFCSPPPPGWRFKSNSMIFATTMTVAEHFAAFPEAAATVLKRGLKPPISTAKVGAFLAIVNQMSTRRFRYLMTYRPHFDSVLGNVMRIRLITEANEDLRKVAKVVGEIADDFKSEYPAGPPSGQELLQVAELATPTFDRLTEATSATGGVHTKVEEYTHYAVAWGGFK